MALINLGTDAYLRQDYAAAVRYYDEARPRGSQQLYSDVMFHAFRAAAYWHVERRDEAQADAAIALRMLRGDPTLPVDVRDYMPPNADREAVYTLILPVLQSGAPADFEAALTAYNEMPARDWYSYANRAAVLSELGQHQAALAAGEHALQLAPDEPAVLNNQCAILLELNRAADALPYCERAVVGAPDIAAVRDSMSDVFAALGRCAEAEREIAEARRLDPSSPNYARPIVCQAD